MCSNGALSPRLCTACVTVMTYVSIWHNEKEKNNIYIHIYIHPIKEFSGVVRGGPIEAPQTWVPPQTVGSLFVTSRIIYNRTSFSISLSFSLSLSQKKDNVNPRNSILHELQSLTICIEYIYVYIHVTELHPECLITHFIDFLLYNDVSNKSLPPRPPSGGGRPRPPHPRPPDGGGRPQPSHPHPRPLGWRPKPHGLLSRRPCT